MLEDERGYERAIHLFFAPGDRASIVASNYLICDGGLFFFGGGERFQGQSAKSKTKKNKIHHMKEIKRRRRGSRQY